MRLKISFSTLNTLFIYDSSTKPVGIGKVTNRVICALAEQSVYLTISSFKVPKYNDSVITHIFSLKKVKRNLLIY